MVPRDACVVQFDGVVGSATNRDRVVRELVVELGTVRKGNLKLRHVLHIAPQCRGGEAGIS